MKNILAAIDFGDPTEVLLRTAVQQARLSGAKLWLVHIAAPDPDFVGFGAGPQSEREFRALTLRKEHRELQQMVQFIRTSEADVEAEALLVQGPTSETLLKQVERLEAELLILGSHGHGRLYDAVVGSVCADMIHKSPVPLLVVPVRKGK